MSVSNDGVSRFASSTVYAPVTFNAGVTSGTIVSNTIDAEAIALTLNSNVGLYVGGTLAAQELLPVGATVYLNPLPFMCNILLDGGSGNITLPPAYAGARIIVSNASGGNRTVTASAGQAMIIVQANVNAGCITITDASTVIFCKTDGPTWVALLLPAI